MYCSYGFIYIFSGISALIARCYILLNVESCLEYLCLPSLAVKIKIFKSEMTFIFIKHNIDDRSLTRCLRVAYLSDGRPIFLSVKAEAAPFQVLAIGTCSISDLM